MVHCVYGVSDMLPVGHASVNAFACRYICLRARRLSESYTHKDLKIATLGRNY